MSNLAIKKMLELRSEWLEDLLAGLLSNGVTRKEIKILEYPGNRTIVKVRGKKCYEYNLWFNIGT